MGNDNLSADVRLRARSAERSRARADGMASMLGLVVSLVRRSYGRHSEVEAVLREALGGKVWDAAEAEIRRYDIPTPPEGGK